jgi:DHA1 family tetracycline resistance protein-like MFS transporter
VEAHDQGKIQGAITSLMSLTSIFAPLIFATGLFSYFTSPAAPVELPGAPFLVGSALWTISFFILLRLFKRIPAD